MKTDRDKVLVVILLVVLLGYVGYTYAYTPLSARKVELEDQLLSLQSSNTDTAAVTAKQASLQETLDGLDNNINQIKAGRETTSINIQDFLLFLSTKSRELGVDIKKFNDLGTTEENGVWRVKFDMGLYGYMKDILMITQNIEKMGVSYDVKSVSIRQKGDLEYLKRYYDDKVILEWFGEEEVPEDAVTETPGTPVEVPDIVETPAETITTEVNPDNIEDQLDILLGLKEPTKTVVVNPPVKTPANTPNTDEKDTEKTPEDIKLGDNFRETKMNFDFTIEFIMFADPKTNFSYIDMYKDIVSTQEKSYTVNATGETLEVSEIDSKINADPDFITTEINRVMGEISSLEETENQPLKDYLNYLLGRR